MIWKLGDVDERKFERNPLHGVIVQVRFQAILKIAEECSEFQDLIRKMYPYYELEVGQQARLQPLTGLKVQNIRQHRFENKSRDSKIILSDRSLAIESRLYRNHRDLLSHFAPATEALKVIYDPVIPNRIGMRYTNVIDRQTISAELGRDLKWEELIAKEFLYPPNELADLNETWSSCSFNSKVGETGELTLRYGLMRPSQQGTAKFLVDIDRFLEREFDIAELESFVKIFSDDAFNVFLRVAGPALEEWMAAQDLAGVGDKDGH